MSPPLPGPLAAHRRVTAVCAHPDDESFGLGAIIAAFADAGTHVRLVCLTAGEGSTLGAGPDLAARRARELDCAARELGIAHVSLLDHPDGGLAGVDVAELVAEVIAVASAGVDALLAFDQGGITGHPDHEQATAAAVAAGRELGVAVWAWALPARVAGTLRAEFGIPFVGRTDDQLHLTLPVDRARQLRAVDCHGSQLADNPVPARRLQLQGPVESLRLLHAP